MQVHSLKNITYNSFTYFIETQKVKQDKETKEYF